MNLDRYELVAGRNLKTFQFESEGPKGKISKLVQFQEMGLPNLFNLAFGDKNRLTGAVDDLVVTNNNDSEKVLATVVSAVYIFTNQYRDATIYLIGSTESRTRLYQMAINKYFDVLSADFALLGENEDEWEWYKKGKKYQAIVVNRKID